MDFGLLLCPILRSKRYFIHKSKETDKGNTDHKFQQYHYPTQHTFNSPQNAPISLSAWSPNSPTPTQPCRSKYFSRSEALAILPTPVSVILGQPKREKEEDKKGGREGVREREGVRVRE